MFVVSGTFVMHSTEEALERPPGQDQEGASAPLLMDINGDTARYSNMSEQVKKPRANHHHGHGKGKHGRKGRRS